MEKLPKVPSRSGSPIKTSRKGDQKVQFSDQSDLKLRGHKVSGKPPEVPRAPPYIRSSSRLSGSSSISSSSSCSSSSRPSSGGGSCSNRGDSSKWTSSLDRKRTGSLKSKTGEKQPKSDLSRSHSLDRRRAESARRDTSSPNTLNGERKRRECEGKEVQNKEKKPKTRTSGLSHSRSYSGERSKLVSRPKTNLPTLSPHNKSDKKENIMDSKSSLQECEKSTSKSLSNIPMEWVARMKRCGSRSPQRNLALRDKQGGKEEDKENEKKDRTREQHKSADKKERGRSLKRESRSGKSSSTKQKHEDVITVDRDVMWVGTGSRKNGYILFNYANLEDPPKEATSKKYSMSYKFSQADSKLIRLILEAHGFSEVDTSSSFFNLYWGNAHFNPNEIRQLHEWQKVNHFPRSSELTRKDRLYMNIKRMQRQFGVKIFDFIPTSFILPTEYREFCDTHLRERGTWIVKPVASSQGKGIYLVNQVDQVPADETSLVCRYIESPLLVDGYKCDLRLYVVVTSLDPLVVYLYEEGLVRLATVKYQHGKNLWNPCIHLTNYSVNKFHSNYVQNEDPEVDDRGNKWSLSAFLRHLKSQGIDTGALMRSVEDVIIKSLLAASYQMNTATNMFVPHSRNCFELYGFDILIDSQLKPWVLEVNLSPSLNIDQPLDLKIKSAMLADLFSLVGIQVCNPYNAKVSSRPSIFRKLPSLRYSADVYERKQYGRSNPIVPTAEELRIVRQVREEYERRGGYARIYPSPDSWALYGGLQEYDSPLNLILHYHLYPQVPRTNRYSRVAPGRVSGVSSSGLASSLERLNCYERGLPKGLSFFKNKKNLGGSKKEEKSSCRDLKQVKGTIMRALENGLALSKYQARMAFSVYLQYVQRRLMIGCDEEKQTDLVYRFLKSATRTLHAPLNVQNPSKSLPSEARAVVISKQLGDFIQAYTRETHIYLDQGASSSNSSLSSQCPTTPFVSSPPASSAQSTMANSMNTSTSSISNQASMAGSTTSLEAQGQGQESVSPERVKKSNSSLSITSPPPVRKSASSSVVPSADSPPPYCLASSTTSINSPPSITCSGSSASFGSPPSVSVTGSSNSINFSPSSVSISSLSSAPEVADNASLPPRVRRLKSNVDTGLPVIEGNGSSVSSGTEAEQQQQEGKDEHITMDMYRAFMSNAGESDLEEVLALQTRLHNSAGVFLETARRSRYLASSHSLASISSTHTSASSVTSTRQRTPNASPHGSPRRSRRSPSTGTSSKPPDPVTSEPHAQSSPQQQQVPKQTPPQSSAAAAAASTPPTQLPVTAASTCCLFGNILKASLKGTNTFIS